MRDQKGFTLIELVVVIFLVGIFLLVAVPKFKDITEVNIKSASRRLTGTIRYLYSEAVFKKRVYKLAFDIDTNEYWVEVIEGNEFVTPVDTFKERGFQSVFFLKILKHREALERQRREVGNLYYLCRPALLNRL